MRPITRLLLFLTACGFLCVSLNGTPVSAQAVNPGITKIVKAADGHYTLERDGQPYVIQGAGGDASKDLLKANGGNSWRTWGTGADTQGQLDQAARLGMTVTVGYWIGHTEQGFSWTDANIASQKAACLAAIKQYKDAPALLCWDIGNEYENNGTNADNPVIWQAIEDIAKAGKEIDHNHPFMTTVAEVGGNKIANIMKYCPSIDIVGINTYAGCASIPDRYVAAGGTKPYVMTEYGPPGTWELGRTAFGAVEEPTSTQKSQNYLEAWTKNRASELNLGAYAFAWGTKREATDTWFGMVLTDGTKDGTKMGCVDALCKAWTGKDPANRCPVINAWSVDKQEGGPGDKIKITVAATDPDGDTMTCKWICNKEASSYDTGGNNAAATADFTTQLSDTSLTGATLTLPAGKGIYRVYCYIYDGKGAGAVASKPINDTGTAGGTTAPTAKVGKLPYTIYADGATSDYNPTGWFQADGVGMALDQAVTANPHSGANCMKISSTGAGWAGMVWQNPNNNWGDLAGGFDFSGATKLTFWARGAAGGESVDFGLGLVTAEHAYYDTAITKKTVTLTTDWTQYSVDLTGMNMTRIVSGFKVGWNGPARTFFLDDIVIEGANKEAPKIPAVTTFPFKVLADGITAPYNPTGWYQADGVGMALDGACKDNPHSGATCDKISSTGAGWAGMCWQNPDNNWGAMMGGYDITGATKLTFWARGAAGGEVMDFQVGLVTGNQPNPDSAIVKLTGVALTTDWKQYTIDLTGKNLKDIITGFVVAWNGPARTIYIDDVQFEK